MFQALLAIRLWTAVDVPTSLRLVGLLAAAATLPFAWVGVNEGRWSRASAAAVLGMFLTTLFVAFKMTPFGWGAYERSLHVAMFAIPAAAALLAALTSVRLLSPAQGFFLAAGAAFVGTLIPEFIAVRRNLTPTTVDRIDWSYPVHCPDSLLESRCVAHGRQKTYYPSNPRGTFDAEPRDGSLDMRLWRLTEFNGAEASIEVARGFWRPCTLRLPKKCSTLDLQLLQRVPVTPRQSYVFQTRLRADGPRPVLVRVHAMGRDEAIAESRSSVSNAPCDLNIPFEVPEGVERIDVHLGLGGEAGSASILGAALQRRVPGDVEDLRSWTLVVDDPAVATGCEWWKDAVHIDVIQATPETPSRVALKCPAASATSERHDRLSFQLRGDRARELTFVLTGDQGAHRVSVPVDDRWMTREVKVPPEAWNGAREIALELGASEGWVEIGSARRASAPNSAGSAPPGSSEVLPERYSMFYELNAEGYRDRDHAVARPEGIFRIALLGDSMVFGQGVRVGHRFGDHLEAHLEQLKLPKEPAIELLNFGICGYATWQERVCFETVAAKYSPQLVVVSVFSNDAQSYREEQAYLQWRSSRDNAGWLGRWRAPPPPKPGPTDYDRVADELALLKSACEQRNAVLAVVFCRYGEPQEWKQLLRLIVPKLREWKVPFVDVGNDLCSRYTLAEMVVHPVDLHPNELAHEAAAEVILDFLLEEGLVPRARGEEKEERR